MMKLGIYFVLPTLLIGCVSPQERSAPDFTQAPGFSTFDGAEDGAESPLRWWTVFEDAVLNERVEAALTNNQDLSVAWERMRAARALADVVASDQSPDLDATAGLSRDESLDSGDDRTEISLGLAASYEVDLWGRIQSLSEAAALRAEATEADYRAAAVSLSSSVTITWYQLAATVLQIELVQSQIDTNQTFLDLLQERFNVGLLRSADVSRQKQLVESTREQRILLQSQFELLEHQLALLEGVPAQMQDAMPQAMLPQLPVAPKAGLPASLLQRRPDIRAAWLRLDAADQDLAAAVSDQYPRLNLTASLETAAERPGDLFEDWLFSIAGQAIAPLIDGGERRAEVKRNEAIKRQAIAAYSKTVLIAFAEVEDALSLEARRADRLVSLQEQLRHADDAVVSLRIQFLNGAGDYLAVLTAIQDKQQLERDIISARFDLISARIALHRALAGGFETAHDGGEEPVKQGRDANDD